MKTISQRGLRCGLVIVPLLAVLAFGCTDDETRAATDRSPIPVAIGGVVRQNCETIARTDYFLSEDERAWYTQNCNRLDCAAIRGTEYLTTLERDWYLEECR